MTFVCIALVLALVAQAYFAWRKREKLIRRVQNPQQVIVEEASRPNHPKPRVVSPIDDAAYKALREEREA